MLSWISRIKEDFDSSLDEEQFYRKIFSIVEELGFDLYSFRIFVDSPLRGVKMFSRNNYSAGWREYCEREGYTRIDAVYQQCRHSILPVKWSDELYAHAPDVRSKIIESGIRHGLSQCIQESSGVVSMFSMIRGHTAVSEDELLDKAGHLMWLANYLHNRELPGFMERVSPVRERTLRVRLLSVRELQVLRLSGLGHTAEQVAASLNLTARTVNYHIASAMAKLDVSNKTSAVVQLALMGLMDPPEDQ